MFYTYIEADLHRCNRYNKVLDMDIQYVIALDMII